MGSGSIDNVAGFAAELDVAFESASLGAAVDFGSFSLQPPLVSTNSSQDDHQDDIKDNSQPKHVEPLQVERPSPEEKLPPQDEKRPLEIELPKVDQPRRKEELPKEDEQPQEEELPKQKEQPEAEDQKEDERPKTVELYKEVQNPKEEERPQVQNQIQIQHENHEQPQVQHQDQEQDHDDKENKTPDDNHDAPYTEPPLSKTHNRDNSNTSTRTAIPTAVPTTAPATAPQIKHPLPCMQGPFDESIEDSMGHPPSQKAPFDRLNPDARRRQMLELDAAQQGYSSRWQIRADSKYHPLWKLIAQISFGIHILHKQLAKSDREVIKILQGHVDDVDSFVEDTVADFDLATTDIDQRLVSLLLPLEHSRTFNRMLCERTFRQSIMDGNDVIERIIARTAAAMHRSLQDVHEGQEATRELEIYLQQLQPELVKDDPSMMAVFTAMRGNAQGWLQCFLRLQAKADHLTKLMNRLTFIVDEVSKRCGIASRRKTPTGAATRKLSQSSQPPTSPSDAGSSPSFSPHLNDKPLPPPPLRHRNTSSLIRNSPSLPQVEEEKPSRPSLSSTTSAQTIDCIRPSPSAMNSMGAQSSRSNVHAQGRVTSPKPTSKSNLATVGDPSKNTRSVSHQTGLDQLARDQARERLPAKGSAPPPQPASPPKPSKQQNGNHSSVRPRSAHARSSSGQQARDTHHEPFRIPQRKVTVEPRGLTGLGIDPSTVQCNSSASTIKDFTCLDDPAPEEPVANVKVTKPKPEEAPRPKTSSSATSPRKSMQASFSVFPSKTDVRLRSAAEETKSRSAKTTPRISTESRTSDKALAPSRTSRESSVPSTTVESTYQSSLETPSLSSTTSQSHGDQGAASSSFPRTPDDFNPHWALSSHPITASMYIPAPVSPITALPPYRGPPAEEVYREDPVPAAAQSKRPSLMQKKSLTTMKNLFAKKYAKKEPFHGNQGLGGFVPVNHGVRT